MTSKIAFFLIPLVLTTTSIALAQTPTATLSGVIRDSSGAVIPGAKISVRNISTGAMREIITDEEGRYNLTNLGPGQYEVRAERAGFSTAQSNTTLTIGGAASLDLTMRVGNVSEVVEVKAEELLIEPNKAEVSRVVNQQSIESLPIIGRNFVDFAKLSSGVAPGRENIGGGAFKEPDAGVGAAAAPRLSFGGQSELNTLVLVDGADNIQTFTGVPRATPSQEAVQEFRILNNTFAAEYGRALGGFVNIVTKSGANDLHGSAYFYGMNNALNAQPLLTGPDPALRQNQYGATLGAPLKKDRTFFFGNYEGQRRAESNKFSTVILNNLNAINEVKRFYGLTPEVTDSLRTNDYDTFLGKIDHSFTASNILSVRYSALNSTVNGFLGGGGRASPASTTARDNTTLDQSVVAGETFVRGTLVNEARVQWSRRRFNFGSRLKEPDLEVSNLLITGKSTSDMDFYRETRAQFSDSLGFVRGGHSLKAGVDFHRLGDDSQWDLFFPARVIFPNLTAFFSETPAVFWWPFLKSASSRPQLSVPFTQAVPSSWQSSTLTSLHHNAYGFFVQDEWKTTRKLTLTYGLRYDFERYPDQFLQRNDLNNFQPRLGLAYAFSPRTVVRAGFGIFNDRLVSSIGQVFDTAEWLSVGDRPNAALLYPGISPFQGRFVQPTIRGGAAVPSCALASLPPPTTAPAATCLFTMTGQTPPPPTIAGQPGVIPPGFTDNLDGGLRTPYAEQASLRISHEVGGGVAISANYQFVHGLKIGSHTGNLNGVQTAATAFGTPVLGARQFPELGDFFVKDSGGFSVYHGGSLEVEKRFEHGFSLHGSYTFSKTINNSESVANLADFPQGQDRKLDRAISRQSVPHRFTLAAVSQIPSRVRGLHDFRFSSLITLESGRFYNVFAGSDVNGDGNPTSDRPGNLGRNTLEGPGYASIDLRVGRALRLRERLALDLSADLFNLFNRTNVKDLNTLYGAPDLTRPADPNLGFGTPRDVFNRFQFQYGAKLRF
jgi:Carboxypeptidase regulatory-like domain/TonB dependent receptor-like, beta-barrel